MTVKRNITFLVLVLVVSLVASYAQATKNLAGETNVVVLDGSENKVILNPVSGASITNLATTTVTAITALADRYKLVVKVQTTDLTKVAYLNIGGVPAATEALGIRVDYNTPFEAELSDSVTAAWVSSGAAPIVVIQTARP